MTRRNSAFSLVEVVLALGVFAFCAVAILSLFSVALRLRAESALETKSFMIAEEVYASIAMTGGPKSAVFRDGPALQARNNQRVDLTRGKVLLGYPTDTTTPFGLWHQTRGQDPQTVWENGITQPWAIDNQIQTLALASAHPVSPGSSLYRVVCQVRSPATLPLDKSRVETFTTLFQSP
jgi:type II secretory pathway pseudopilin PulG